MAQDGRASPIAAHPTNDADPSSPLALDLRAAAEALFASPTLVDLLAVFCAEPDRRFYVNELIKRIGRFPRSVQLALAKLETAGLVRSERQANARYYRIESAHPFYPALRQLVAQMVDPERVLRQALASVADVRVAFLRAVEPDQPDLDLVVIVDGPFAAVEQAVDGASRRLGRPVSLHCLSADDWSRQARRPRSFVRWLLDEPRTYLVGDDGRLPG
jgi:DNA-binding transcriptional ArsR family regulator